MSKVEQLAARLVEAGALAMTEAVKTPATWAEQAPRGLIVAVLRELAAKPDGYLRYQEDGGITYTKTLRGLADHIEKDMP